MLTKCLINKDITVGGKLWLKNMKFIIQENFRKVRLNWKSKNDLKIQQLFEKRSEMMKRSQEMSESEKQIAELIFEKNRSLIVQQVSEMSDASSNFSRVKCGR